MKSFVLQRKNWFSALSLLFLLVLSLAACSTNASGNGSSKPPSTADAATSPISTPSSTPTVQMGAQPCPDAVKTPASWTPFVSAPPDIRVADSVKIAQPRLIGLGSVTKRFQVRETDG